MKLGVMVAVLCVPVVAFSADRGLVPTIEGPGVGTALLRQLAGIDVAVDGDPGADVQAAAGRLQPLRVTVWNGGPRPVLLQAASCTLVVARTGRVLRAQEPSPSGRAPAGLLAETVVTGGTASGLVYFPVVNEPVLFRVELQAADDAAPLLRLEIPFQPR